MIPFSMRATRVSVMSHEMTRMLFLDIRLGAFPPENKRGSRTTRTALRRRNDGKRTRLEGGGHGTKARASRYGATVASGDAAAPDAQRCARAAATEVTSTAATPG